MRAIGISVREMGGGISPRMGSLEEGQHLRAWRLTLGTQTQPRQAGHRNGQGGPGGDYGDESSLLASGECSLG